MCHRFLHSSCKSLSITEGDICAELNCHCFVDDKSIQNRATIRETSRKWIWSNRHDVALTNCLTSLYRIPLAIVSVIKHHSYSDDTHHYIKTSTIHKEKYYPKNKDLLNKTLCSKWHQYFTANSLWFSIALIDTTQRSADPSPCGQILDFFASSCYYLPTLRQRYSHSNDDRPQSSTCNVKRTLYIDECSASIGLTQVDLSQMNLKSMESVHVVMFLLDGDADINAINDAVQTMDNKQKRTCIIVQTNKKCHTSLIHLAQQNQLCTNYNMPCFKLLLNSKKSMHGLFQFAMKYYWFCNVQ